MSAKDNTQFESMQADLTALETDLDDLVEVYGVSGEGQEAYAELDAELQGTSFSQSERSEALAALNDPEVAPLIFGWIKKRAEKAIKKLVEFVKKHRECVSCVPMVTKAVALFKAGQYGKALAASAAALACIKRCASS